MRFGGGVPLVVRLAGKARTLQKAIAGQFLPLGGPQRAQTDSPGIGKIEGGSTDYPEIVKVWLSGL